MSNGSLHNVGYGLSSVVFQVPFWLGLMQGGFTDWFNSDVGIAATDISPSLRCASAKASILSNCLQNRGGA